MWAWIAQAAIAIGGSLLGSKETKKQQKAQNAQIHEANLLNAIETANSVTTLMGEQAVLRDRSAVAQATALRQASLSKDSAEAAAAAAGVRGASADAVIQDIDRELGWAQAEIENSAEVEQFNMTTRLRNLISGARANVSTGQVVQSNSAMVAGAIGKGLIQTGANYASTYFQFGGKKTGGSGGSVSDYTGTEYSNWVKSQGGG